MEKNIGKRALEMNNNLNIDIIGWLCIFLAGLGIIFPFSIIAPANLIFIGLGVIYFCYFVLREARLQADPPGLKEARQNWLLTSKVIDIEESKFERKNNPSIFMLAGANGITFNAANKTPTTIPWSEILQVRTVRIMGKEEHTVYTLKNKFTFDQSYKNHKDLVEIIKRSL
jgi:hypothetical protein